MKSMSHFHKWKHNISHVPLHVFFIALVIAVSTVFVSQEVSISLAQNMPPNNGDQEQQGDQQHQNQPDQNQQQNQQDCSPKGTVASFVCGTGGKHPNLNGTETTYFNSCTARQDGATILHEGFCGDKAPCGNVADPVCGNDDQTWLSSCYAIEQGGGVKYQGACKNDQGQQNQQQNQQEQNDQQNPMGNSQNNGQPGQNQQGQNGPQNQMGNGQNNGQQNGQGQNQMGNNGQQGQNNQMDEQRQKQQEQQFSRDKNNFRQFSSMLKKFGTQITKLEKQGIVIPADLKAALDTANSSIAIILAAKLPDDAGVQDAMITMQDVGQTLQDWGPKLGTLEQMPNLLKQAGNEVKKLQTKLASITKTAAKSKVDVGAQLADATTTVNDIVTAYQNAQQLMKTADADGAMSDIQDDVFGKMGDAYQSMSTIDAVQNVSRSMTSFTKFISRSKLAIAKLAKNGEDVTDVQAQLDEMVGSVGELKLAISQKVNDPTALLDQVDSIIQLQNNISDITGGGSVPQMQVLQNGACNSSFGNFNFSSFGGGNNSPQSQMIPQKGF